MIEGHKHDWVTQPEFRCTSCGVSPSQDIWNSYGGLKVAFGEDPCTVYPRGHAWVQEYIYGGFAGWGPNYSMQRCAICKSERRVLLHPGPDGNPWSGGMAGMLSWGDCETECQTT
jgi:hypothetical protein